MKKTLLYLLYATVLIPIIVLVLYSIIVRFKTNSMQPEFISIEHYLDIFNADYFKMVLFSVIISAVSTILAILVSLPASYSIANFDLKYKRIFSVLLLLPILMPQYSYFIGLIKCFHWMGINDTIVAVIVSHMILIMPYAITSIKNNFIFIGNKYDEVCCCIGDCLIHKFIFVTIPLIKNTLVSTFCLGFTISYAQYFITLLAGGGRVKTYAMYAFPLIMGRNRSLAATVSFCFVVCNLICFVVANTLIRQKKEDIL